MLVSVSDNLYYNKVREIPASVGGESQGVEIPHPVARGSEVSQLGTSRQGVCGSGVSAQVAPKLQPLLMRDGRRLWRFRAESIPDILDDNDIQPAVEARWCRRVLVADGHDLIVVEPWLSDLPDDTRTALRQNAGTIIALLRGESRVRTEHLERSAGAAAPYEGSGR